MVYELGGSVHYNTLWATSNPSDPLDMFPLKLTFPDITRFDCQR